MRRVSLRAALEVPMSSSPARRHPGWLSTVAALLVLSWGQPSFAQAPLKWSPGQTTVPDYETGGNPSVPHGTDGGGYLRSVASAPSDFGTLRASMPAGDLAGKRVRLSAYVRTEDVDSRALAGR